MKLYRFINPINNYYWMQSELGISIIEIFPEAIFLTYDEPIITFIPDYPFANPYKIINLLKEQKQEGGDKKNEAST